MIKYLACCFFDNALQGIHTHFAFHHERIHCIGHWVGTCPALSGMLEPDTPLARRQEKVSSQVAFIMMFGFKTLMEQKCQDWTGAQTTCTKNMDKLFYEWYFVSCPGTLLCCQLSHLSKLLHLCTMGNPEDCPSKMHPNRQYVPAQNTRNFSLRKNLSVKHIVGCAALHCANCPHKTYKELRVLLQSKRLETYSKVF